MHRAQLRAAALLIAALLVIGGGGAYAAVSARTDIAGTSVRLPGHVLAALARAALQTHQEPSATPITITVVLKRDDQKGFEHFLRALYDPKSKDFHLFRTQEQLADRFGPSRADYGAVRAWLESEGFTIVEGSTNRLTITARGTRAQVERAMGLKIDDYALAKRTFYANDRNPDLPKRLASIVQAVDGLSNLAVPRPSVIPISPNPPQPPQSPHR
jgi:subtilase family serine protease